MVKRSVAKKVSPLTGKLYLSKAEKFLEGAKQLLESKNWESASALAIHSVISSCDSLTAKFLSRKHSGASHQDVANLLGELPLKDKKELRTKRSQVRQVITLKTNVEYDNKAVRATTARKLVLEAERINKWAKEHVS